MADKNPPRIFRTPDNMEWTFLQTCPDYKKMQQLQFNNRTFALKSDEKRKRIRLYCNRRRERADNCKFMLLALKTNKKTYHVYQHGEHHHSAAHEARGK
jgi:hypothetical protein